MPSQVGSVVFALTADIRQLQSQLRTMEGNFSSSFARVESLGAKVSKVFGALGIGLGVGAVIGFGKSLLDLGDKLSDLSDQTGHSIEVLGGIRPVLDLK